MGRHGRMPLEAVMTALPRVVAPTESLANARKLMDDNGIRHLPVAVDGRLRGMVREHDLAFVENRPGVDPATTPVSEAMTANVYAVAPDCPLGEVFGTMADHRYDAVVVVDEDDVVGIVTTVDAMNVLAQLLGANTANLAPSQVRERILADHRRLLALLDQIDAVARRVLDGDEPAEPRLRQWAKDLYGFLRAHLHLENEILVPALVNARGFGRERAESLRQEHREQEAVFERVLGRLARGAAPLATELKELARSLRDDIAREEREFLAPDLLEDDVIHANSIGA
ncbi:MAG: CBS domain-containing protein [Deltaproteobacteria bacterium]|nr:CBS domain-containing protein [Deltaproteobacteria bacterium]